MTTDAPAALSADFAHRVIERVRKLRRRRRFYRLALTSTAACIMAAAGIFYFAARNSVSPSSVSIASVAISSSQPIAATAEFSVSTGDNSPAFAEPLAFFFPGATAVGDFESSEASYWHSYDSWWTPQR